MRSYMLLMTGYEKDWKAFGPEEKQTLMEKYAAFVTLLKAKYEYGGGSHLDQAGYSLHAEGSRIVVDGPFPETKEVLNGYMIFKANNWEEALAVAKQCPALTHGEAVQIYDMDIK